MANNSEEKNYATKDYGNLTLVELKFQEMQREVIRIREIVQSVKEKITPLVNAINKLAGLVEAPSVSINSLTKNIDTQLETIESFVNEQISRYTEINEFTKEQIDKLISLVDELFDEDGQLVTYEINGEEVTENFTDLLNRKENETALTNCYAEGYRVFDGSKWISDELSVSEDRWENFEAMYLFFMKKGLTDEQISGIMANAAGESGFNKDAKNPTSTAKGFFQWLDFRYPEDWDVETQLNHAWDELENGLNWGGISTLSRMQNCTTPEQASNTFLQFFEGAGSPVDGPFAGLYPVREQFARDIYNYIQKMKSQSINT